MIYDAIYIYIYVDVIPNLTFNKNEPFLKQNNNNNNNNKNEQI